MPDGDSRKAEEWLDAHGDYLYRYALARLGQDDLARDAVQETLIAAWKGRDQFHDKSSVRTWLTGILKHKIVDHCRRQIRERALNDELERDPTTSYFNENGAWRTRPQPWQDDPERLYRDREFSKILRECIDRLPQQQRHIFSLRELNGETSASICKESGISTTNLHVIIHRARLALRKCLEFNWFVP
ncbi:MAG TPA: sigma-70 family RNA polymerase sigma factor [Mariprofundaceae bacterium]|nr:sigma-70 family RNA polymerase sigma factor [Mariprofundaceae bacterium]